MIRRQFLKSAPAFPGLPRVRSGTATPTPLFNCTVAGFQYYDGLRLIQTIRPGDRLNLVREPENPHDEKAISVHAPHDEKLGFLPRCLNEIPAAHLDSGRKLHAVVHHVDFAAPPWEMLEVTVVMM